jgi:hypothetical protein
VTGLVEVIGAVALVVPDFAALGAAWLGAINWWRYSPFSI